MKPVVDAEEVEWAVELYDVGGEENVVAGRQSVALVYVPGTQQRPDSETNGDDNVLSSVQDAQRRVVQPFLLLRAKTRAHTHGEVYCSSNALVSIND